MRTIVSRPGNGHLTMTRRAVLASAAFSALTAPTIAEASVRSLDDDTARRMMDLPWAISDRRSSLPAIHALVTTTCPYSRAFMRDAYPNLIRSRSAALLLAAVEGESRTAVAGAALRRDATVIQSAFAGRRPVDRDLSDDEFAAFNHAVRGTLLIREASVRAGFSAFIPSFVWARPDGRWRITSGYSIQIWSLIMNDLSA